MTVKREDYIRKATRENYGTGMDRTNGGLETNPVEKDWYFLF